MRIDSSFTDDDDYITSLIPIKNYSFKDTNQVVVKEEIERNLTIGNGILQLSFPEKLTEVTVSYTKSETQSVTMINTDYWLGTSHQPTAVL